MPHSADLQTQLEALIDQGLTFSGVVEAFAKRRTPKELALVKMAKEAFVHEGTLEVDDNAIVSIEDGDDVTGAYVMAWQWAELDEEAEDDGEAA